MKSLESFLELFFFLQLMNIKNIDSQSELTLDWWNFFEWLSAPTPTLMDISGLIVCLSL